MSAELDNSHIQSILGGDKEAFRYFVQAYKEMGYSIAISMVKDQNDAKDVVQNAFISAYKCLPSFRQDSKFSTWFYKIVVNESLKQLKRANRTIETSTFKDDIKDYTSEFNEAVEKLDLIDRNLKIDEVLDLMKPKEALVLKLHYLHEESILEMVRLTGFTKSNIKVLLHRARKSFLVLFIKFNN
ncbi:RNA polymerase sigma factor [Parapedobacter tibetensis]|uniref:RNA polymerase sigma factor n=1 Tax=Parapedobacter tibetensis TaxID=2972951 RepID=UPI00214D148B|nr:sigma-70 family RNA polymerase sigma factor [Parapedobacter tibetensis]